MRTRSNFRNKAIQPTCFRHRLVQGQNVRHQKSDFEGGCLRPYTGRCQN